MATVEYQITVASKTESGNYGSEGNAYFYNGQQAPMFQLYPGDTYKFMQEDASNDGHLLKLSLISDGTHNSGSAYTTNVTHVGTPGNSGAYTQIVVSSTTPQNLFYYCHNHSGMGCDIEVDYNVPVVEDIARDDESQILTTDNRGALYAAAEHFAIIPTSDVSTANDTITLTGHGYENNYTVKYQNGGGTSIAGLTSGNTYYVIKVDANTFKLSSSSSGSAETLTGTGNADQYIDLIDVAGVAETTTTQLQRDLAAATVIAGEIDDMDDGTFNWSWIKIDSYEDEYITFPYSAIDFNNNTINIPNHDFDESGDTFNHYVSAAGLLELNTSFFNFITNVYATRVDANNIKLRFSSADIGLIEPTSDSDFEPETIEYTVTVASRDTAYGGTGNAFYIDGTESPQLSLIRGNTYKFLQADGTNSNHPLKLSITDDGTHNSGSAITSGITYIGTPGSAGAYTQYVVPDNAPDALYYFCGNHSGMGNYISVSDSGDAYTQHKHYTLIRIKFGVNGMAHLTPANGSEDPTDPTQGPYAPTATEKQLYLNNYISHLTYLNGLTDWGSTNIDFIGTAITKANNISF